MKLSSFVMVLGLWLTAATANAGKKVWICNYKHQQHDSPSECTHPEYGGHWEWVETQGDSIKASDITEDTLFDLIGKAIKKLAGYTLEIDLPSSLLESTDTADGTIEGSVNDMVKNATQLKEAWQAAVKSAEKCNNGDFDAYGSEIGIYDPRELEKFRKEMREGCERAATNLMNKALYQQSLADQYANAFEKQKRWKKGSN